MRFLAGLTSILLLLTAPVQGADLHVDRRHASAADKNPGTVASPLATISAAVERMAPGDTVVVHEGVYREQVRIVAEGTSWSNAIRLVAAEGETATIKGSDVVTGWQVHEGAIWKKRNWTANSQMVFADGEILQQIGGSLKSGLTEGNKWLGRVGSSIDDMMPGSFYCDQAGRTLYVWLPGGADPNQALMEASMRRHLLRADGQYFEVAGFRMMHSNTSSDSNWSAVPLQGEHFIFRDNTVLWCDYIGVGINGTNIEALNNEVNYCGCIGIAGRTFGNVRLNGNRTDHNNWRRWERAWQAGGMKFIPTVRGLTIENHKAFHNFADGIWIDAYDTSNVVIRACETAHNLGAGIHYERGKLGTIVNNVSHHNHKRGIYLSNSSDCLVAHNVCYQNGMSGIVALGAMRPGDVEWVGPAGIVPARRNRIIGNILMENINPRLMPDGWGRWRPELILPDPAQGRELFGDNRSDYNIFYRSEGRFPFWYNFGDQQWASLELWSAETGNDTHSLLTDPLFVAPEAGDFRVRAGSPAIGLVPWLEEVSEDYNGRPRPAGQTAPRTAGSFVPEE